MPVSFLTLSTFKCIFEMDEFGARAEVRQIEMDSRTVGKLLLPSLRAGQLMAPSQPASDGSGESTGSLGQASGPSGSTLGSGCSQLMSPQGGKWNLVLHNWNFQLQLAVTHPRILCQIQQ